MTSGRPDDEGRQPLGERVQGTIVQAIALTTHGNALNFAIVAAANSGFRQHR
jgi:hypothetical protein